MWQELAGRRLLRNTEVAMGTTALALPASELGLTLLQVSTRFLGVESSTAHFLQG